MKFSFKQLRPQRLGPNEQGFSLIETLVVIAIMAIAAGMTVPNLLSHRPAWELNRAANDIYSNLQWTRLTAIREGRNCRLTVDSANNQYTIELLNSDGSTNLLRSIPISTTYPNSGISISISGTLNQITYWPRGTHPPPNRIITISNSESGYNIRSRAAGVVLKERAS